MACAPGGDIERWARERPELAGRELGHLGEATPYALAGRDELIFFWCRWPLAEPLRVALPTDASGAERTLLRRVLRAWEAALPGLDFVEDELAPDIVIVFDESGPEGARSAVDCAVSLPIPAAGPLPARLRRAEIRLRRREGDAWGRPRTLGRAELLGSAAHELGHALGLQGHARRGPSSLSLNVDRVRKVGERLERGDGLREPAMAALYALPPGTVVGRRRLEGGSTREIDAVALGGGSAELLLRLGDQVARIQREAVPQLRYYLREPGELFRNKRSFAESIRP